LKKKINKDIRNAYGIMQEKITDLIRSFRDIQGKNVFFTAKMEKIQDESSKVLFFPSMPGNKTAQSLPYFFDEVFALHISDDGERVLQTILDKSYTAKDRSGELDSFEPADLGKIIDKIKGVK